MGPTTADHRTVEERASNTAASLDAHAEQVTAFVKDALYISVGAGVLAFQKAQVRRRELRKQLTSQMGDARGQVATVADRVGGSMKTVEAHLDAVEEGLGVLLDQVEQNLPEQARDIFHQAREAAKDARGQVRQHATRLT